PELYSCDVFQKNRGSGGVGKNGDVLDVLDGAYVPPSPDHIFNAGKFQDPSFHIAIALLNRLHHLSDGDVVCSKAVRIHSNLVLFDITTDARHLRNTGDAFKGQFNNVILDRAEL